MTAVWTPSAAPTVRFGCTVARRQAPRSVDRSLVKRVLRESSRQAMPTLADACRRRAVAVDVVFRLKAARRPSDDMPTWPLRTWRRALRTEADSLLQQLARGLAATAAPLDPANA
jgi:ribonuclease P protein component